MTSINWITTRMGKRVKACRKRCSKYSATKPLFRTRRRLVILSTNSSSMALREPFEVDEWYHCYNRGVDKRRVFQSVRDYQRFLQALYLCNGTVPIHQNDISSLTHESIFEHQREGSLVSIGAYCLMPNHFHIVMQEIVENGITSFMQKVGTAYTMYFNIRNDRTGNLFLKPFRARRITNDAHFLHIPNYVHLNPAEMFEPRWKEGIVRDIDLLEKRVRTYAYSSAGDFFGTPRVENAILDTATRELFERQTSLREILIDAAEYHQKMAL